MIFFAVVEPNRNSALIGVVVLEARDFVVECVMEILCPRDVSHLILEFESIDF